MLLSCCTVYEKFQWMYYIPNTSYRVTSSKVNHIIIHVAFDSIFGILIKDQKVASLWESYDLQTLRTGSF